MAVDLKHVKVSLETAIHMLSIATHITSGMRYEWQQGRRKDRNYPGQQSTDTLPKEDPFLSPMGN